jgi:DNA-binding NarL/FixJ family response regulator
LADDVFDLRFMVKLALERSGRFVVVAEAENGDEAVKMAEQHQPDLVLLDVSMPVKDGLQALPDIRAVSPDAKVVMLSGFEASRLAAAALESGAAAYLEKGIPPGELVDELLKVLGPAA